MNASIPPPAKERDDTMLYRKTEEERERKREREESSCRKHDMI